MPGRMPSPMNRVMRTYQGRVGESMDHPKVFDISNAFCDFERGD